jgi:imidazole glycerol-phosphate synthase subunit HisF
MLKIRVMPTLLYKDVGLVKGARFDSRRRIGSLMQAVKVYSMREVDELVFLDIAATTADRDPDYALIDDFADECFMPLTVGGGIRSLEHVHELLRVGADKVAINTAAIEEPNLMRQIAKRFGSQCLVVSIDAKRSESGEFEVYVRSGQEATGLDPVTLARRAEQEGAGELLLTCIDRDGTLEGYDLELVRAVTHAVRIPVIASGGAGCYEDMGRALCEAGASAVAASAMFQFTQRTPLGAKQYLRSLGLPVRC